MSIFSRFNRRVSAVAAVTVFAVLAGASASWAYWTTAATAQVTVNSADLTVTTANFSTLTKTFANEALVGTGSVTVTNNTTSSSAQKGAVTITFSATGSDAYRSYFTRVVWLSTTANPCTAAATPGTALLSGNWGTSQTLTIAAASGFAVGEARTYCVRTTVVNPASNWPAEGAVSFTPRIDAAIAVGNYTGAANATTTVQTQFLFPATSPTEGAAVWNYIHRVSPTGGTGNYCSDLESGNGPTAIGWPCKTSGTRNQSWGFVAVAGKPGYYTIKSNLSSGIVLQQNTTGVPVEAVGFVSGQLNQQWMIQRTDARYAGTTTRYFYQLVNASSGQCLTYAAVNGTTAALNRLQMANCDGTESQEFLVVRTMFSGVNGADNTISCAYTRNSSTAGTYTVTLGAATPNMRYELRVGTTVVGSVMNGSGTGNLTFPWGSLAANATTTYEIYEDTGASGDAGTLVATGSFTRGVNTQAGNNSCTFTGMG